MSDLNAAIGAALTEAGFEVSEGEGSMPGWIVELPDSNPERVHLMAIPGTAEPTILQVYAPMQWRLLEETLDPVSRFAHAVNRNLGFGNFLLDEPMGRLAFKGTHALVDVRDLRIVPWMVGETARMCAMFGDKLGKVRDGQDLTRAAFELSYFIQSL